jgi:2-amino-4-hydroxy-6-hydroxymethyldihydropteridine diphosphokinase
VTTVLVAAGSNVEPLGNLRRALDALVVHYPTLRTSRAFRNRAVGFEGEDFVNLVIALDTDEDVHTVIERLHEAEARCGRARLAPKWAPRAIDLDILLYGDRVCEEPGLTLPRPDLVRRAYMLGPAAELEPRMRHPTLGVTLEDLWRDFPRDAHALSTVDLGWPAAVSQG